VCVCVYIYIYIYAVGKCVTFNTFYEGISNNSLNFYVNLAQDKYSNTNIM